MSVIDKAEMNNPNWRGDAASYSAIHKWLYDHKERAGACQECGDEGYTEFANLSGEYRRDVEDFIEVCVPCHRKLDLAGAFCSSCGCSLDERTRGCRTCNSRHLARRRKQEARLNEQEEEIT